jgi:uncharacterized SAM-binding protein YcdF (DUF218 family)
MEDDVLLLINHAKTILKQLILPPAGPLLLAFVGALLLRRRPRSGALLLLLGLGSLWALALPAVSHGLVRATQHYPALDPAHPGGAQAIVILGGGGQYRYSPDYAGPAARPQLLAKLAYGAFLQRRTGLPVLVTGWDIEAVAMRATLQRNFGIEPRWVDSHSYDTFDNAHNSAVLLQAAGVHRIILLTMTTHMWRAAHEFAATGLQIVPAPVGVARDGERDIALPVMDYLPDAQAAQDSYYALYELLGEPVRELLALTHLRRQRVIVAPPASHPTARAALRSAAN